MLIVHLTAIFPGVLREDVSQAQAEAAVAMVHVSEILTVWNLHALLHPYNVQRRRACEYAAFVSDERVSVL
jgi:hypothetical protein